jgi:pyruvate formate lyase activating enzyme
MTGISRRTFLRGMAGAGLCALGGGAVWAGWQQVAQESSSSTLPMLPPYGREALYYTSLAERASEGQLDCTECHTLGEPSRTLYCHVPHQGRYVRCALCPHRCVLAEGERGLCRTRENRAGKLYSFAYGNPCAIHTDPIEKKPFFHFLPGTVALSLATAGCPLRCKYCQNYTISQYPPEETQNGDLPPAQVAAAGRQQGAPTIAYTYSEPMAFYEYMLDTARLGRQAGLRNAVISSGYANPEPLRELCQAVDAIKIDLKGFNDDFYREVCGGRLEPVLEAIRIIHDEGVHLEIVNLVVPTLNDDPAELRALAGWLLDATGPDVPLHFTRFHPDYQLLNLAPTPIETLTAARQAALEVGLRYVYVGNVPGHEGNHTYCPNCGRLIIQRAGMSTEAIKIIDGRCGYCGAPIAGVWS